MINLTELLEPIAAWFRQLNIPEPIVQWGHPAMMAIVIFIMGTFVGIAGWRGRILTEKDKEASLKQRSAHRQLAPWLFIFIAGGYIGGLLSLVMQKQPILESPHFWTGSTVLILLGINGGISLFHFFGDQPTFRNIHAYLGSMTLVLLFIHAILGFKLGLSI
jgi:fucose 4-O-acetylase-like acetyltransferase